jgi:hypothetical protein
VRDGRSAGTVGTNMSTHRSGANDHKEGVDALPISTPEAQQWAGWGTALKPAHEPAVLARKPFSGTVAANVLTHGTGGINVDGCRVETDGEMTGRQQYESKGWKNTSGMTGSLTEDWKKGRWPANLIHDGSDEVVALFPQTTSTAGMKGTREGAIYGGGNGLGGENTFRGHSDTGSAARFFYTAKCSKAERGKGNNHPTVKPLDLMAYLCRLVTPPGGTVLDPFCGSGTTLKAALAEGFSAIGIEKDAAYFEIIENRMDGAQIGLGL